MVIESGVLREGKGRTPSTLRCLHNIISKRKGRAPFTLRCLHNFIPNPGIFNDRQTDKQVCLNKLQKGTNPISKQFNTSSRYGIKYVGGYQRVGAMSGRTALHSTLDSINSNSSSLRGDSCGIGQGSSHSQ